MEIRVNGLNFYCLSEGEGPLVILLHGFPQFSYAWRHQIPALAKHFRVVAPDLRGYGKTEKPEGVENYAMHHLVEDIAELIRTLGYAKVHLVGHDWGGGIAWRVAQEHPELIDKLVILNAPFPQIFFKALRSNWDQMRKSWYMFFFQIRGLPETLFKLRSKKIVKQVLQGTGARKGTFTDEDIKIYTEQLEKPGAFKAALNYFKAAFHAKPPKGSGQITVPTLLIWGEKDQALGKDLTVGMEKYFTNTLQIEYLPDASHWVMEEEPEKVNSLILRFLTDGTKTGT